MGIAQIIILITSPLIAFCCGYKMFQIYQLNGYKTGKVLSWLKIKSFDLLIRFFALAFLSFAGMFVYLTCFGEIEGYKYLGYLFYCIFGLTFIIVAVKEKKKTPLKFTPRVIRCAVVFFILVAALAMLIVWLSGFTMLDYSLTSLLFLSVPLLVMLSHLIMSQPEHINNLRYVKKASKKLDAVQGLIKIGVTGSYGKTTAKNILGEFLSCKYLTSVSPSSFNTPIGLASYINSHLRDDTQVFIAEMGARQSGDIKELCDFIKPKYGLITAIGKQHMETFGSSQAIVKTKFELIESLPNDGAAFFNRNCIEVEQMYKNCTVKKFISGSSDGIGRVDDNRNNTESNTDNNADGAEGSLNDANNYVKTDAFFSNASSGRNGTIFNMTLNGETVRIKTPLLGAHIPSLITSCAMIALELGVELSAIVQKCEMLEPIPHRLQLIENGDTLILDDAYNSNPEGAKNALEILKTLEGTKIIITPGIVEQGDEQEEINLKFGEQIGEFADYAIFTGPNSGVLKKGALLKMGGEKIYLADSLETAVALLGRFEGKKAVLFENDLPDNF